LIVDDNQTNCNILKSQLEDWRFSPTLAHSAGQALKILSSDSGFELVITDMQMPDMDGVELSLAIRKVNPTLQIILLSSIGHEQRKQYDHLFCHILTKPVKHKVLSNAIHDSPCEKWENQTHH
jgi:CheY-like chemotaxis protein